MKKIYTLLIAMVAMSVTAYGQFNVTFQVDMSNSTPIADTVSVAGSFQAAAGFPNDWAPGETIMTDGNNDDIYDITVQLPAGSYEYKFLNGAAWGTDESVPGACATNGNRGLTVSADTTLDPICFGTCAACPTTVDTIMVTFQVDMTNEANVDSVSLAGSVQGAAVGQGWSDWTPGATLLTDPDMDNVYTISFMLPEGTYQYKYLNGTAWGTDESVPSACASNNNREIVIAGPGPQVIPVHCFASCDTCVPPLPAVNVTFRVDMTNAIISSNGLTVSGNFQNPAWEKDSLPMMDPDSDNIYERTESIVPGEYQYKYFNGGSMDPDDGEFSSGNPGMCAVDNGLGGFNRLLDIVGLTNDTILPVYEFNTCNTVATDLVDYVDNQYGVIVFPNPMSQTATVQLVDYDLKPFDLNVVNMMGQTVISQKDIRNEKVEFSREGLNSGIYFLEIRKDGQKITRKIIIE